MKTRLTVLLISILYFVGAQNQKKVIPDQKFRGYDILLKDFSPDGQWLTFTKAYDTNSDSLVIIDREKTNEQYFKVKALDHQWSDNLMIIKYSDRTEIFDYQKNRKWHLPVCESMGIIKDKNLLVLYNSGKVLVYDLQTRKQISTIESVSKMFYDNNQILMQIEEGKKYQLRQIERNNNTLIYSTDFPMSIVQVFNDHSYLITESAGNNVQDVVHYDVDTKKVSKISEYHLPDITFARCYQRADGSIMINADKPKVKRPAEEPEIWATSDNMLLEKYKNSELTQYLWNPKTNRIKKLGSKHLERLVDINNKNYFLQFSYSEMQDYTKKEVSSKVYRYDIENDKYMYVDTIKESANFSPNGQYIIYRKDDIWKLVDINSNVSTLIKNHGFSKTYFTDTSKIIFDGSDGIWEYDIRTTQLRLQFKPEIGQYKILNYEAKNGFHSFLFELSFSSNTVNEDQFIFEIFHKTNLTKSVYKKSGSKYVKLVDQSPSKLVYQKGSISKGSYLFAEEDYNLPKQFIDLKKTRQKKIIFASNINDPAKSKIKIEVVQYKNSDHDDLKGILYYPLDYQPEKKYPMVVYVYQIQSDKKNKYPMSLERNITVGFDIRTLNEKGYFVYLPDIVFGTKGTGLSALDCVNHSLDAIKGKSSLNFEKVALVGHSHGGYITNFIATHSNRFATYVSGAGNVDLVRSYHSMNENFVSPFYWQFESGQYELFTPFVQNKDLYNRNSPINYVENISAPVLLWNGKKDINIESGQVVEFYIALKRNNKKANMLIYPDEGHYMAARGTAKDLHSRVLQWLGHYLKGEKKSSWME